MKAVVFLFVLLPAIQNCLVLHDTLPPYASCACQLELIKNNEHGKELLSYFNEFHLNFSHYEMSQPVASYELDEQCPMEYTCTNENDYKIAIGQNELYHFGPGTRTWANSICREEQKIWDINLEGISIMFQTPYLFFACIDFTSPLPSSKLCNCPAQMITNATKTGYQLGNFNINGKITEDRCSWEMSCRNGGMFQTRINGEVLLVSCVKHCFVQSSKMNGECNMETQKWKVTSMEEKVWDNVPVFEYSCVNLS